MIVDLDGTLVDAADARVSPFDGAYQYGDGLFDTLRSYRGFLFRLDDHLERLRRQAELLQLDFDDTREHWSTRITALLDANDLVDADARVRLQISRGGDDTTDLVGAAPTDLEPVTMITARAVSERLDEQQRDGIRIMSMQPAFARGNFPQLKSLNYLPSLMAMRFAREAGFDEALLVNSHRRVLEAATGNVFAIDGNVLRTPSPRLGLLPGITREIVLEFAPELGLRVDEVLGEIRDLLLADEVFLTGSVKEIVPVVAVDNTTIGNGDAGPWTRRLQERYREQVERERD
jgi:D-amino acid aminotransferase